MIEYIFSLLWGLFQIFALFAVVIGVPFYMYMTLKTLGNIESLLMAIVQKEKTGE